MRTILIFLCVLLSVNLLTGQEYQPGKLWVSVKDDELRSKDGLLSSNETLNTIFNDFQVAAYFQAMGFAKTPSLRDIYEIHCDCDESALKDRIIEQLPDRFNFVEYVPTPFMIYDPNDHFWQSERYYLWHLTKVQADTAWDYTLGNPQIKIGIPDYYFDLNHPDLASQIYPPYDAHSGDTWDPEVLPFDTKGFHGTVVASFAAAKTAEAGANPTPNGNLSAIGFNCKMVGTSKGIIESVFLSTVMGCDVINASWMISPPDTSSGLNIMYEEAVKEIISNGTVIVTAAGNGFCVTTYLTNNNTQHLWGNCNSVPPNFLRFSAPFPFHLKYDTSIIIVTSTDSLDKHTLQGDTVLNRTHSHFPEVSVCSPGWYIMGARLTYRDSCGYPVLEQWPYAGWWGGTSFATPIVSGLCGLIKSINPCLTPAQVKDIIQSTTDPVTDAYLYPGLVGTGRINAYKAVKYAQDYFGYEEYIIGNGQDITWTTDVQAKKIIIEWGGKLTVKSTVYMLPGADIVVLRGGHLVIDSGLVTTCKGLWNGIQVSGRSDMDQFSFYNQGHLTLINGATIQNAMVGVQLARSGATGIDPTTAGGIVKALNANFINCVTGVAFYPYENFLYDKKNIMDNRSYFKLCNFILDTNYNHVFFSPMRFVYMEGVRGVSFNGCSFLNHIKTSDYPAATGIDPDRMIGIMSLDAAFKVDEYCLNPYYPCDTSAPSRFEKLKYGIYAFNTGYRKYPQVKNSAFINNKTGIYLGAIENAVITSNYFYSPAVDTSELVPSGGLYLDHCNMYTVEENVFTAINSPVGGTGTRVKVGIAVNSSGPYPNEIYKNDFSYLTYGILAMNQNKRDSVGLCIKCNNFSNCEHDIAVVVEDSVSGWGIAEHQGSREDVTTAPAGNVFSEWTYHDFDLFNDDNADPFTYFHHNEALDPDYNVEPDPDKCSPSVSLVLNDQQYIPGVSCPSRQGGGGNPTIERNAFDDSRAQVMLAEASLAALVDGGDTEGLTMDVVTSTLPSAVDLTLQLLNESPYLSDTVMKSAVLKEDVLSNAMIRDILVENPQAAKSAEIMQLLDERADPMPQYMKDQVEQGKFTTGNKENLEAKRSFYLVEMERAFNNLSRYYLSDSAVTCRLDSLAALFGELNTLENRYRKVFIHLENGDTALAGNTLNGIPNAFALTSEQSNTHQKYEDLLNILIGLSLSNGTVMNLDSARIAGLLDIYDNATLPGIYARNMLVTAGYLAYREPYLFPDNLKTMVVKPVSTDHPSHPVRLIAFPNPAAFYTIIGYDVSSGDNWRDGNSTVSILVRDLRGVELKTLTSAQSEDQLVLDVRNFKPGLYIIDLFSGGHRKATTKLMINR